MRVVRTKADRQLEARERGLCEEQCQQLEIELRREWQERVADDLPTTNEQATID